MASSRLLQNGSARLLQSGAAARLLQSGGPAAVMTSGFLLTRGLGGPGGNLVSDGFGAASVVVVTAFPPAGPTYSSVVAPSVSVSVSLLGAADPGRAAAYQPPAVAAGPVYRLLQSRFRRLLQNRSARLLQQAVAAAVPPAPAPSRRLLQSGSRRVLQNSASRLLQESA